MTRRPPCPGDPEDYVWVASKEGPHWRRKRGSVGVARLNAGYQEAANLTQIVSPAAARVRAVLMPYTRGITTGRLNNRICNAFRKSLKETKTMRLAYLKGLELQAEHPLDEMLIANWCVGTGNKKLRIEIPIDKSSVKPQNRIATDFYFEAVLLYGDLSKEKGLNAKSVESALYSMGSEVSTKCVLELPLPRKEDWCLLLKLSSFEGNELAAHTKHYRMKVIEANKCDEGWL